MLLCIGAFGLRIMFLRFTQVVAVEADYSFELQSSVRLQAWATVYFLIHQLLDIWIGSKFGPLRIKLL